MLWRPKRPKAAWRHKSSMPGERPLPLPVIEAAIGIAVVAIGIAVVAIGIAAAACWTGSLIAAVAMEIVAAVEIVARGVPCRSPGMSRSPSPAMLHRSPHWHRVR
jgi:hypothetical protein